MHQLMLPDRRYGSKTVAELRAWRRQVLLTKRTPRPKGWIPEMGYGHKSTVKRHDHFVLRKSSSTAAAVSAGASWGRSWPMTGVSRR
jgi:hypothetical protein